MPAAPPFEHTPYDHHIGSFGPEGLGWQRSVDPAALSTDQLVATRAYSRNLETDTVDEIVEGCTLSLRRYGFCVIDHAIPREQVPAVRHELSVGTEEKLAALSPDEQRRDGLNGSSRPINQLVLQPLFAQYVCQPAVVGVAKTMLDSHVRITATGTRNFLDGFGPAGLRDVCMCLSMVWYMQDTGPDSDGITVSAPIPGDMQIVAPAGSVYIADSRMWHSTATHNTTGQLRVAGVNRWTPWWFNDTFCDHGTMSGWLSTSELKALPLDLQPLLEHRCIDSYAAPNGSDLVQQPVLDRAAAANERNSWGFARIGEPGLVEANSHLPPVRVARL